MCLSTKKNIQHSNGIKISERKKKRNAICGTFMFFTAVRDTVSKTRRICCRICSSCLQIYKKKNKQKIDEKKVQKKKAHNVFFSDLQRHRAKRGATKTSCTTKKDEAKDACPTMAI
jgi:hypothetical protein